MAAGSSDLAARRELLKTERRSLPVHRARKSLLRQLRQLHDSTAVIIGETGSGKTTQIPQVYSLSFVRFVSSSSYLYVLLSRYFTVVNF